MTSRLEKIEEFAAKTAFSGVISLVEDGTPKIYQAFGDRDVKNRIPNSIETRFGIASGTKLFTALGIGILIDQGKLQLETALAEIDHRFTGFVDPKTTVQQLLNHTSGIFDYYDEELDLDFDNFKVEIPWPELKTPSDYWPLFIDQSPKFEPGARYAYSNGGYIFLGILIEQLSSMPYRDFIQQHLLEPVGMTHSGFFPFNNLPPNTANGYLTDRETTNIYQLPIMGGGDGGMYTTCDDMQVLWERLGSNQILSPALTARYLETSVAFDQENGYALGLYKQLNGEMFWIEGSDAGVGFFSGYWPDDKRSLTIISNITDGEVDMLELMMPA